MRIAILGAPGSGKETQARLLAERSRVPCISIAALLNKAAAKESAPKPQSAESAVAGDRVMKLLEERLRARDSKRGFVIDGFPPNIPRAQALDTLLGMLGRPLQISVYLKVDDRALVKRIAGQWQCRLCGALSDPNQAPAKNRGRGRCSACGGELSNGSRPNAKAAAGQIEAYHREADPLLPYYKAQHKLRTVPAGGGVDEVQAKICDLIDLEIHPLEMKNLEPAAEAPDQQAGTIIVGGQVNRTDPTSEILASRQPRGGAGGAKTPAAQRQTGAAAEQKAATSTEAPEATTQSAAKQPPASAKTAPKPAARKAAAKKIPPKSAKKATASDHG